MDRTTITGPEGQLWWFDRDKADEFEETTRWDGHSRVSIPAGGGYAHERLYHTAGGRWVLERYSQWEGTPRTFEYIANDEARDWLILCEHEEAVEKFFGEIEDERGPGRPEIGNPLKVHLGDVAAIVETYSAEHSVTKSEAVRQLIHKGASTS